MKKILVVGAGYAGLSFIQGLTETIFTKAEITLINNNPYHYHAAQLHKVASGEANDSVIYDIKNVIDKRVNFIVDDVVKISKNSIVTKNSKFDFNYLVLALGYEKDTFGIEGMQDVYDLGSYKNALAIKDKIYSEFEKLKNSKIDDLKITICGGGLSGVELAGSIATEFKEICDKENIDFSKIKISIVEALDNILPIYDEEVQNKAMEILKTLGVNVMVKSKIIKKNIDNIEIENFGELKSDVIVWTAGVKGNSLIESSGLANFKDRVRVDKYLRAEDTDNIFAIGDVAALKDEKTDKIYNPTAQISCKMGSHLAKIINSELTSMKMPEFIYENKGLVCSIGKNYAVGNIFNKNIFGKFAVVMKKVIEKKWNFALEGIKGLLR